MVPIVGNVAALTVALIFYAWRAFSEDSKKRRRTLAERVTYLLWVAAEQVDSSVEQTPAGAC